MKMRYALVVVALALVACGGGGGSNKGVMGTAPTRGAMGAECPVGTGFFHSPTFSGCAAPSAVQPNTPHDFYSCGASDRVLVQCMAGCSFCIAPGDAVPTGCYTCGGSNPSC
jgi:hypothetical protein